MAPRFVFDACKNPSRRFPTHNSASVCRDLQGLQPIPAKRIARRRFPRLSIKRPRNVRRDVSPTVTGFFDRSNVRLYRLFRRLPWFPRPSGRGAFTFANLWLGFCNRDPPSKPLAEDGGSLDNHYGEGNGSGYISRVREALQVGQGNREELFKLLQASWLAWFVLSR